MGEGAARAIAIGSIALTVASLTVAVIFTRKRSRIRVGFDVTKAVVSVIAITEMARVTGVTTPGVATAIAIAVGLGLGFAQGSSLKVSSGERGFYATRSPIGIALWGMGIVLMQGAGIAARTGTLRVGQTIAWFSACLGIGLVAGRKGPLQNAKKEALAGAGVAALVAVLVGPALITGAASPAVAVTRELDHSQLCELVEAPLSPGLVAAQSAAWLALADEHILTSDELCQLFPTDEGLAIETTILEGVPACNGQRGTLTEAGTFLSVYVFAYGDADEAAGVMLTASQYGTSIGGLGQAAVQRYTTHGDEDPWVTTTIFALRGPYILSAPGVAVEQELAAKDLLAEIDAKLAALPEQADAVDDMSGQGDAPVSDTGQGDEGAGDGSLLPSVDAEGDGVDGGEPLTPQKAAEQAVVGLIAAAAIGLITWGEAAAEIRQALGGSGGGAGAAAASWEPTGPTTTVYVTGADAEAAIRSGAGGVVPIPKDQQSVPNISVEREDPIRTDEIGTHGVIRSVGPIVRGPDGQVSVAVEVDPYGQPSASPPPDEPIPIELEPIVTPGAPPEMVPGRPPPTNKVPPTGEEPPTPSPAEFPPPPDEPPAEEGGELPSDEAPPSEHVGGAPADEDLPTAPPEEPRLTDRQIDDIVRWGWDRNRSPDDIRADLAAANGGRAVELPVPLDQVETPAGLVTLTAEEAAAYRDAVRAVENLSKQKEWVVERMNELEKEARRWSTWEQLPEYRAAAGIADLWERQQQYEAARGEISAEIARLNRRPDPYTYDGKTYSSYDEALADWRLRDHAGVRHAAIADAEQRLVNLHERHTSELTDIGYVGEQERRLARLRSHMKNLEAGNYQPQRELFSSEAEYQQAVQEWNTRDSHGRYFDDAERTRQEIAALEASVDHPIRIQSGGMEQTLGIPGYVVRPDASEWGDMIGVAGEGPQGVQPALPEVEPAAWNNPASTGDDGSPKSAFDEPARQLERIARDQDFQLGTYRRIDGLLEERERFIAEIEGRAGG